MTNPPPTPGALYDIEWTETSQHSVTGLTAAAVGVLIGATPDAIDAMDPGDIADAGIGLADGLANLDEDGFEELTRDFITVTRRPQTQPTDEPCERCEEPSDDLDAASGLCPACVANNDSRVTL
jgi:hypothetical protein